MDKGPGVFTGSLDNPVFLLRRHNMASPDHTLPVNVHYP
jgi:hypothetical protein